MPARNEHPPSQLLAHLEKFLNRHKTEQNRIIISVSGPPGAGKTTIAAQLENYFNKHDIISAASLPMDGFHLNNNILEQIGLLSRKGAPQTFDFNGFYSILRRLKNSDETVYVADFDRNADIAIAGAKKIGKSHQIIIVEGNYLLLDQDPWHKLQELFDYSIFIQVPMFELRNRLIVRWLRQGLSEDSARKRAEKNDLANANLVLNNRLKSDFVIEQN